MTAHDHREIVPGCYRCELSADEMDPRFDRPRPVPDPTHTNPITVHGIPAEDHHAHVCPVCRVREEKP